MTTKSVGSGFTTRTDSLGRVRLVKVYGKGLSASEKIRQRKSKKRRVTKAIKGMYRP